MTFEFRVVTRRWLALAVTVPVLVSGVAHGQSRSFGRVSGSFEELYDSNLFAAPENAPVQPQSDWVTRVGPMFEAGRVSPLMRLEAHYGFTAEKFRTLAELDKVFARQEAATTLSYQGRSYNVNLRAGYLETQTPTELNLESMRFEGRSRAQRVDSSEAFVFNRSAVTSLKLDHSFKRDSLVGGVTSTGHVARVGIARELDERSTVRADYRMGLVDFSNGAQERSHVGTFGVLHAFSPVLGVEVDGGVRSTNGEIDPEVSAVLRNRLEHGAVAVRYIRTRQTTIGGGSSLDVRRVSGEVTYTPNRVLELKILPTRASSGGTLSRDVVYYADIQATIQAARRWSILALGRAGQQDRSFPTADTINYRSISLKTIVTLGPLERDREEPENETP